MSLATMQAARTILKSLRATYSGEPRTRAPADEKDFGHLDLAAYRRFRTDMEARGFRFLGDYEVVDVTRASSGLMTRTFVRTLVSADGTVVCGYGQVKQRLGKRLRILFSELMDGRGKTAWEEFKRAIALQHNVTASTDFEDGRSVYATNAEGAGKIANPPAVEAHLFPQGTPVTALLEALDQRNRELRAEHPDGRPIAVPTLEKLFELQDRAVAQKAAYRKSVGWITRDELLAMANGNDHYADAVYGEIQKQLTEEAEAAS